MVVKGFRTFVWPFIVLTPQQMAHASDVERRRTELAKKFKRKDGNRGNVRPDEQLRGVQAELAAKLYFDPIQWNEVSEAQHLDDQPDLQSRTIQIDVKSIGHQDHQLVSYKVKRERAYLLVLTEDLGEFWIVGYMMGHELAAMPLKELQPGRAAHCALQFRLHDPATLRNAVYDEAWDVDVG